MAQKKTGPSASASQKGVAVHNVKWRHSNLWSCNTISMLWGSSAYSVKLSGEDLSRYSNKIESVGLRKCPYYHSLSY